jgi:hypothetical protein
MRVRAPLIAALTSAFVVIPTLAWGTCAPEVNGIFPASGLVGTNVSATVRGHGLTGATVSVFGDTGVAVTPSTSPDTALNLQIAIDPAAPLGERILVIETPAGIAGASFTVNPAGGLIVSDVSPLPIATRGFGLDVTLTGQRLDAIAPGAVTVSGDGVAVTNQSANGDGTALDLTFDVASDATVGARAIEITSSVGGAILQMVVQRPAPTVDLVAPGAVEIGGVDVPLVLTGANLTGAAVIVTSGDAGQGGVTLGDIVTVDDGMLTTTVTVDAGLSPEAEPRLLIVTTESGQTTAELFVVAPGVPTVTTVTPGAAEPGDSVAVTLKGLHLAGATGVTGTADVVPSGLMALDDETVVLTIDVDPGAATVNGDAVLHTLTLQTTAGDETFSFGVVAEGQPFIGRVRPPFANRGSLIECRVLGVNLGGVVPGTGVALSGPKIIESNAAAIDDQTVRAVLDIDPLASVGYRDVSITTSAGGSFVASAAFRVNVPGQVPIITDVQPRLVEPGVSTAITVTGSGFAGGSALVTGPGAVVSNVQVDPTGVTMTFDLVIDPAAPLANRAVIVVTENGIARCGIGVLIGGPQLVAAKLVKTGARFTVASTGFRLLVFEFSMSPDFPDGPRTVVITSADDTELVLSRQDVERIRRAFRDRHQGFVRATGITTTNLFGTSDGVAIRR